MGLGRRRQGPVVALASPEHHGFFQPCLIHQLQQRRRPVHVDVGVDEGQRGALLGERSWPGQAEAQKPQGSQD